MSISRDTARSLQKRANRFSLGTFLSKLTGLLRDVSLAATFGDDRLLGAFIIAFRLSFTMRRLLGEGALSAIFIPLYEDLNKRNAGLASRFFRDLTFTITLVLLVLTVLVELGLFTLLGLSSPEEPILQWVLTYSQLMWPGVLFICLNALNCTLLQCENHFFLSAISPIIFNLAWSVGTFFSAGSSIERGMYNLCWVTVLAYIAQWALTTPYVFALLAKKGGAQVYRPRPFSPEVRGMLKPLGLGIIGVAGSQINLLVDNFFAFYTEKGGVMHLWYAARLWQAPLSLVGIALSGVLLPAISRAIQRRDFVNARATLKFALRRALVLLAPATFALIATGFAAMRLIFERGAFSPMASLYSTRCLWGYALGLIPQVFVMLLSSVLYGLRLYRITTLATLASVALNIACNALFVFALNGSSASIALATTISAYFNLWLLARYITQKYPHLNVELLDSTSRKVLAASLVLAASTMLVCQFLLAFPTLPAVGSLGPNTFGLRRQLVAFASQLLILGSCGLVVYRRYFSQVFEELLEPE